jgi:hypothetical protein
MRPEESESNLEYMRTEGLDRLLNLDGSYSIGTATPAPPSTPIAPDLADLARLHSLVRSRMCFTVLEFGVGF